MKIAPHQTILITDEGAANVILKKWGQLWLNFLK
jgi:DNA-binding transcriptional regulator LsrR (DeoR family)